LATPNSSEQDPIPPAISGEPVAEQASENAELPRGTLILHIGDSFAAALGIPLAKRLKAAGLRNILQFKTASYIPTWAFGKELEKYVANYNPDLVLITLGANEIEIPDPPQRAGAIRRLIRAVGNKPCVWISPPLWKPDTGLLGVIRQNAAPCRYLDSDAVVHDLPRGRDKIHPSTEGREIWADAVLAWLIASRDPSGASAWTLRPESAMP
jgi:lysophospholipase L1-like esterase